MSDQTDNHQNGGNQGVEGASQEPATTAQSVNSGVQVVNLEDELKQSFIDYAMSVIVDRALPDVRDGLKPVHRRVLYDMYDLKVWHSGQTKKSARIVGDVIGRFHPHGDTAVYETIVRMAQWFSMREPLVFGQGNFGDIDGDGAAAMRYTEVKMTRIAEVMLQDIDKDTVNTYPNYDGNEQIPEVLPTRFPNLLVNGSSGIAVGMATNIPTHNLAEVIDGAVAVLDNPDITLEELMHYIPGPDFPTGGEIVGREGVKRAYATGRGRCIIRARTHIEEDKSGRKTIVVDEIPYVVHKVDIVKQIAQMVREKKIDGIAEINDLSDKSNPVRIAIDLKRDAYEEAVLNNLFQNTMLQSSFPINMVALVDNHPRLLPLKDILVEFVKFRREVVTRRTVFLLRQDRRKAHVDEGLMVAKANIQKVIDLITSSQNQDEARQKLMSEAWDASEIKPLLSFDEHGVNIALPQGIPEDRGLQGGSYFLSEAQAKAILALQLSRLTHLAQDEIRGDYASLLENIRNYLEILNNPDRMKQVIRDEMLEVKKEFGNPRRTGFTADTGSFDKGDLIARQDVIVTLSNEGYVKYQDIASYESQHRGGKGRLAARLKDADYLTSIVVANTHDLLMCFTSKGRGFITIVYDLPTSENRTWRGRPIQNIFKLDEGEKITAMLPLPDDEEELESTYFFLATKFGRIKKIRLSQFKSFIGRLNDSGIKVVSLADGDELIGAELSSGDDDVYLFSSNGKAMHFCDYWKGGASSDDDSDQDEGGSSSSDDDDGEEGASVDRHGGDGLRPSGRGSGTVSGIKLIGGATCVSLMVLSPDDPCKECLIVGSNGIGKRMKLSDIPLKLHRGSQGVFVLKGTDRAGDVIGAVRAASDSEFMLITDHGQIIRSPMESMATYSRAATGTILMRPAEGEKVIAVQSIPGDVVENSRRTSEARQLERKALKEQEEAAKAADAPQQAEDNAEDAQDAPEGNGNEDNGDI
jgi:DNA gyrase subunit A